MSRRTWVGFLAALALLVSNVATASAAGRPGLPTIALVSPGVVEPGVSTAVTLQLPASVAALEGRLLVNDDALEFIGVAPRGAGSVLRPTSVGAGSYAFAAYGLSSAKGHTTLDLVVFPKVAGQLQLRLVIDAAADAAGHRLALANRAQQASLGVGRAATVVAAPQAAPAQAPTRAALPARDIVGNGRIDRQDLDSVRGDWYANHAQGVSCGALAGDANADGCVDVVDLQAELAAQGTRSATPAVTSLVAAQPQAIGDPIAHTFVVTSTADTPDAAPGNGLCADSTGQCTLRAAITEADWLAGNDLIQFALAGTAPVTIQLASRLPNITSLNGTLTIDGYSQPGSAVNTASAGSNAIMGVEIRGNGQAARETPFYISSPGNVIRGLLIDNVYRGVMLDGANAHDNRIVGNWIGFRKDTTSPGSGDLGVGLNYGANHNLIGTPSLADRNVIGNFRLAEDVYGTGTDYNVTQNNVLCMRPNGTATANCSTGIDHNFGPKHHLIGGTGPNERNVIGGTTLQGIEFSHGWNPSTGAYDATWEVSNNQVIGNWIGFRGDGSYNASFRSGLNASSSDNANGINVYDGSNANLVEGNYVASVYDGIQVGLFTQYAVGNIVRGNFIGLSPLGENAPLTGWGIISRGSVHHNILEANTIANAAKGGVGLTNTTNAGALENVAYNTRITRNIITNTNGPAIDLYGPPGGGGAGPDPNDPGDADTGANGQLNTPVFTSVSTAAVSGTAYAGATVELYRASRPAGQYGLPIAYLGSATVAGDGTWTLAVALSSGDPVTALQTMPDYNTSELAANVAATPASANQAPVFDTEFGDRTDAEGAVINLDANATDPDLNQLTYSAVGLPDGITINSSTGVFSGTLSFTASGVHAVTLIVSDGSLSDTDSFTWTVTNTNRAPVFSTEFGDWAAAEGVTVNLDANASDPDGDSLTYSATGLPDSISINPTTGVVSGTLSSTSSGTYNVVLSVSDGLLADTDSFVWTVTDQEALAEDLFGRTLNNSWGSAPTGGAYTLQNSAGAYDVDGSVGTMAFGSAGANRSAVLAGVSATDIDLSFRVATDKLPAGGAQFIYGIARRVSSTTEYRAKLRLADNGAVYVHATAVVNNTETSIGSEVLVSGLTYTPGTFIWLRAQFSGTNPTTIRISAWADGSPEPATWQYSATNSAAALQGAGAVGMRGFISGATSNAPVVFSFDDFRVTSLGPSNRAPEFSTDFGDRTDAEGAIISFDANASDPDLDVLVYSATGLPAGITINPSTGVVSGTLSSNSLGTYNVTLSVSDGSLVDTDTFTWTVTGSTLTVYASDLFGRTLNNSWGSAPTGGAYTLQGTAADYDVNGSIGTIAFGNAGVNRSAVLTGVSATDIDLSFRVATNKMSVGGAQFIYGIARRVSSTTEYRAKLRLAANGNVYVHATAVVNNTETSIGSEVQVPGLTYTPGSFIWLRAQFSGTNPTTIRIRAWADGSPEPATWQYSATNSAAALQGAGAVGLRGYISGTATNTPILLTFDDFRVTSLGGP